jgi:23S rRNA pseudouridine2605 synthase
VYLLVNKPVGVLSTNRDPAGRTRVLDLVGGEHRLFTVGRLDKSSEGLILVTNDGQLAYRLLHPRFAVERTYEVVLAGEPTAEDLEVLRRGIHLAEGRVRVVRLRVKRRQKHSAVLEMVLTEGRNREIRRMAARIGHKVLALKRIGFGPLRLGDLPPGGFRPLTRLEFQKLRDVARRNRPTGSAGLSSAAPGELPNVGAERTAGNRPRGPQRARHPSSRQPARRSKGTRR